MTGVPNSEKGAWVKAKWLTDVLRAWLCVSAAILALLGLALVFTACGSEAALKQPDVLLGVSNWLVLTVAGLLHLALGGYLFAGRNLMNKGLVVLWASVNLVVYGVGMLWVRARAPFPAVVLTGWDLGVWPRTLDMCWRVFVEYLLAGSVVIVVLEWRRLKRLSNEAFWLHWREMREKGV